MKEIFYNGIIKTSFQLSLGHQRRNRLYFDVFKRRLSAVVQCRKRLSANKSTIPHDRNMIYSAKCQQKLYTTTKLSKRELCTGYEYLFSDVQIDKYNGITIDLNSLPLLTGIDLFQHSLKESLDTWKKEGRTCIWIKVPIDKSSFIAAAAQLGFQFHHAEHQMSLLKLWLNTSLEDMTPRFATHQVGVSGMVYREETKEILVVKDKNSQFSYWKFPGGLSDLEEDIGDTAEREVLEETGIRTEFLSILAMRQQHKQPGAFGRSDIFIVCRLKPLSFDIKQCQNEISHCKWMNLEELYANTASIAPITHRMCQIMLHGVQNSFSQVDIVAEEMKSVYKGLKYKLYHRPLKKSQ